MSFHKLDKAKDKNFWSVRVNSDIRLIVHRSDASLLLCYVDHHDKAYDWAERRKLETHPKTGAAQLVEIRETVKEIVVPVYVQTEFARGTETSRREERRCSPDSPTTSCSATACPPSGSTTSRRRPRTRCWSWPTTCLPRRRRRCWNWRRAASLACLPARCRWRRIHSIIPTPSAASA